MAKRGKTERNARGAASKRSLSRTRIVDAALAMIERDGAEAFSMRLLAAELGVTPMALYNHVGGKLELLRNVAGQVLAEIDFDNGAQDWGAQDWGAKDWRERDAGCFQALRAACLRHPGAARLLEVDGVAPAAVFAPMQVAVVALTDAGLSATDALRAYFTLIAFTLGQAGYQARGPVAALEPGPAAGAGSLDDKLAEIIGPSLENAWDFDAAFEFGLRLILDGIEAALGRDKRR